jgi:putative endonuclease
MARTSLKIGLECEDRACVFLRQKKYRILDKNFRSPYGEIDIIAQLNGDIVFFEVKARSVNSHYTPRETVDRRKRDNIRKTALFYINKYPGANFSFDVLEIIQGAGWRQYEHIQNAFLFNE